MLVQAGWLDGWFSRTAKVPNCGTAEKTSMLPTFGACVVMPVMLDTKWRQTLHAYASIGKFINKLSGILDIIYL